LEHARTPEPILAARRDHQDDLDSGRYSPQCRLQALGIRALAVEEHQRWSSSNDAGQAQVSYGACTGGRGEQAGPLLSRVWIVERALPAYDRQHDDRQGDGAGSPREEGYEGAHGRPRPEQSPPVHVGSCRVDARGLAAVTGPSQG